MGHIDGCGYCYIKKMFLIYQELNDRSRNSSAAIDAGFRRFGGPVFDAKIQCFCMYARIYARQGCVPRGVLAGRTVFPIRRSRAHRKPLERF
jgi:hypothetical protein